MDLSSQFTEKPISNPTAYSLKIMTQALSEINQAQISSVIAQPA